MFRRIVSGIMIALLLTGTLFLVFNIHEFMPPVAFAHADSELSGWASVPPTIDGVIKTAEWASAAKVTYTTTGGVSGAFYVMNDAVNLYIAVVTTDPTLSKDGSGTDDVSVYFDNDHDGVGPESGDDIIGWRGYLSEGFKDGFSDGSYVWRKDTDYGGTSDGVADATNNGTHNHFEIVHPLDTADQAHDFSLWMSNSPTVGFALRLTVDGVDKGWWPSNIVSGWRDIVIFTPKLSAWASTTPLIDGVLRPAVEWLGLRAEWENASKMEFTLSWNGEHHRATVYVMNDYINLYLAFEIHGEDLSGSDKVVFNFDNDNDGLKEPKDDCLFMEGINFFQDAFFAGLDPFCDDDYDGTLDGVGASIFIPRPDTLNGSYGFEIAHPLNTSDNGHDFSLGVGDTVGFNILFLDGGPLNGGGWPTFTQEDWSQMADIVIAGPPLPPPQPSTNLKIRKIEITQAIQWLDDEPEHEDNSLSLARGKSTVVRVYVDASGYASRVRGVSVYLYATDGASGVSLVEPGLWSSAGPLDVTFDAPRSSFVDRGNENHTANFLLPPYWVDRSTLTLVAFVKTHDGQVETNYTDNWMSRQTFSFTPTKSLKIGYILVDYRPTAPDENPNLPSNLTLMGHMFFEKVTPMPDLSDPVIYYPLGVRWNWTESFLNQTDLKSLNKTAMNNLLAEYAEIWESWPEEDLANRPDQICVWFPMNAEVSSGKAAGGVPTDNVSLNCESRPWGFAHEIGHNYDFNHSWDDRYNPWYSSPEVNSSQTYGYDTQAVWFSASPDYREPGDIVKIPLIVHGGKYGALMSYKDNYRWISPYEWENLTRFFDSPAGFSTSQYGETQSSSPSLWVSGVIYRDNTGNLNPVFQSPSFKNLTLPSGPYTVQLRGPPPAELLLYSQSFDVSFESDVDNDTSPFERVHFMLDLPFITSAYSVSLWNGTILLDKITASANPPQVVITYPNGGEIIGNSLNVTWVAADPDGDPLTFKLYYSSDNGITWIPLSSQITGTSYRVDTSMLPGGSQWLIRVLASDGFYTSEDQSNGVFTVPLKGPQNVLAFVQTRIPNETFLNTSTHRESVRAHYGDSITLKGSAFDPEDGVLNGTALVWASDINGTLGTGRVLSVMDLIPGTHNITLTATDSHGNNATKSFTITVVLDDIAMTGVTTSRTVTGQGFTLNINATVENQGNSPATFNVTVYANATEIETQEVALASGNTTTIVFTWNTTGFAKGNYTIWAYAWSLPNEIDMSDNFYGASWVLIAKVGDLGGGLPPQFLKCDGKVDGIDLALFVACYKKQAPPEVMYLADLGGGLPPQFYQCDGKVDGLDLALFVQCYKGLGPDP